MKDMDIRPVLDSRLQKKYAGRADTIIVHELGVSNGQNRVDVAVVNGILSGYEIKSERDTLVRLERQVKAYGDVFDHMTLVVHEKHLEPARAVIPVWWQIQVVTRPKRSIRFEIDRPGHANPAPNPYALAALVWRGVGLGILKERGLDRGLRSATRDRIWNTLAEQLPLPELQAEVRKAIRRQQAWLVEQRRQQSRPVH